MQQTGNTTLQEEFHCKTQKQHIAIYSASQYHLKNLKLKHTESGLTNCLNCKD